MLRILLIDDTQNKHAQNDGVQNRVRKKNRRDRRVDQISAETNEPKDDQHQQNLPEGSLILKGGFKTSQGITGRIKNTLRY